MEWASWQIRKLRVAHAPGMPGTFSPPPLVSDPDIHHGTCVTHVPWCMPGELTSGFLWCRCREKRSRHSRRMRNPKFCVSGKRPMLNIVVTCKIADLKVELFAKVHGKLQWIEICKSVRVATCMFMIIQYFDSSWSIHNTIYVIQDMVNQRKILGWCPKGNIL